MRQKKKKANIYPYLNTRNMAAGYGRKIIVGGVEITVERGETVTLIGPNGSGKSTVLKSIIGQLKPVRGSVYIDGINMNRMRRADFAKRVSVLMTDRVKTELMTCFDVVATARYPYTGSLGLLSDDDRSVVYSALRMVRARKLADVDFNSLSDGQKQRVLLARCIAQEPELIVLDEPTSFLDIKYKIELLQVLKKLAREKGTAIIMSMHEIDFARQISDRVICLGGGEVDRIGTPDEVLTPDYLCTLFDIDEESYEEFLGHDLIKPDVPARPSADREDTDVVARNGRLMRKGITTGTCAAAAAYGAATLLITGKELDSVKIVTPSGNSVEVNIKLAESGQDETGYSVIKDSGDDPDVTNGATVSVHTRKVDITNDDIPYGVFGDETHPGVFIAGGEGVGTVTGTGLEIPVGYPAINKVPRSMIYEAVDTVRSMNGYDGGILVTVSVKDGALLARKTFNPDLGIEGGISILGTSGILEPMSDKAIVDTIEALIRQKSSQGHKALLVTPGQYGLGYVKDKLGIDASNAVKCSNFIGDAIDMALSYDIGHMLLVGNLGKLIKLAAGIMNTHSRVADGRMDILCTHLAMSGADAQKVRKLHGCINTDSALELLKEWDKYDEVLNSLTKEIHLRLKRRAGDKCRVGVIIFSEKYGYLAETGYAREALDAYCREYEPDRAERVPDTERTVSGPEEKPEAEGESAETAATREEVITEDSAGTGAGDEVTEESSVAGEDAVAHDDGGTEEKSEAEGESAETAATREEVITEDSTGTEAGDEGTEESSTAGEDAGGLEDIEAGDCTDAETEDEATEEISTAGEDAVVQDDNEAAVPGPVKDEKDGKRPAGYVSSRKKKRNKKRNKNRK
ncbi:MAG: cobalt-precorrin-5B (C(1))-methyltransferase CbiD [Lachnospiraceae bacterium]|nr:cobalt-precorrin-5B (C(1))-methyltransferase CbiD [Lachnospiraceae bacterium]